MMKIRKSTGYAYRRPQRARSINIDDPVRMYLKEIGRVPLLSATEEITLPRPLNKGTLPMRRKKISKPAPLPKKKLTDANLRLVVSIAKRYVGRGMLFLDLIQEAIWAFSKPSINSTTARAINQYLCYLVDPPGHYPRHCRPSPDDPNSRPHGRNDQ